MKINLFLAQTEYHLLISIHLASTLYSDEDIENVIFVIQTEKRLKNIIKRKKIKNIRFKYLENVSQKEKFKILKRISCDRFIFFQEDSLFNCNLINYYKKNYNSIICLGPDGYKPYAIYKKKHKKLSMLRNTFDDYKKLIQNKIFPTIFNWSRYYDYASTRFLDEVYLTNPKEFIFKKKHSKFKILEIPKFNEQSLHKAGIIFNLKDNLFPIIDKGIYYFNQPFKKQLEVVEINFLKDLIKLHPENPVNVKLHPLTTDEKKKQYLRLKGINLIDSKIPAELFILNLKNSILFSGWSTVLITNNNSCNLYFNLPIYKTQGSKAIDQSNLTILPHIKLVSNPYEMKFPVLTELSSC
jgi:hypothetical protein